MRAILSALIALLSLSTLLALILGDDIDCEDCVTELKDIDV